MIKVKVPMKETKSFSFEVLEKGNITSNIEIKTHLVQGEKINLVVLYGTQSESSILKKSEKNFTLLTLCHDSNEKFDR